MKWLERASFSERRFPGWFAWFGRVCVYAWMAGFLAQWIDGLTNPIVFDTGEVLLFWPALSILLLWLLALASSRLWHVSFLAAIVGTEKFVLWVPFTPILGLLFTGLGIKGEMGFANGWQALASLLSGGVIPFSIPPASVTCLWMAAFSMILWSWWRDRGGQSFLDLAKAIAPSYVGFAFLFLTPSFLGWTAIVGEIPLWSAPSLMIRQAFAASQIDAYAWPHVYERFPLAIGGESIVSQQWILMTLAWLLIVAASFFHLAVTWRWSPKMWMNFAEKKRLLRVFIPMICGIVFALFLDRVPFHGFSHLLAFVLLFVSGAAFLLAEVARDDLAKAREGQLASHRPLAFGAMRSIDLLAWQRLWLIAGYVSAGLLGWPILLSMIWTQLSSRSSTPDAPFHFPFPVIGYVLAGWMTLSVRGSFDVLPPLMASLVFLGVWGLDATNKR